MNIMVSAEYSRFPDTSSEDSPDDEEFDGERQGLTSSNNADVRNRSESSESQSSSVDLPTTSAGDTSCPSEVPPNEAVDGAAHSRRFRTVLLFSLTTVLLFADQNLLSPNLTAIADEFQFSDQERDRKLGGDIALAFFLLGAPASFIVGCLADQSDRSVLFAWTVGIGEGACFATFWTRTYLELYVCRAITGFSVGGAIPLIYSVLGDLFAAEDRHATSAVVGIGTGVGIAFGQGVAGFLGPTFGWRVPFLVVSIPALICAALVLFTVPDPERGGMERIVIDMRQHAIGSSENESDGESITDLPVPESSIEIQRLHHKSDADEQKMQGGARGEFKRRRTKSRSPTESPRSEHSPNSNEDDIYAGSVSVREGSKACGQDWRAHFMTLISLLSCPTVVLTFLQGAPGCLPWGIVNSYLNDFLSEDRGMTVEGATATVLCFGAGNFFGMLVGGAGGRHLYILDPRYPMLLAGFSAILGCIPFWLLLNTVHASSPLLYIGMVTLLAGLGTGVTGPIVKATLQNVTLPTTRGQAFSIYNLFDDFGRGLGPVFVSLLIVSMGGRTPAFNVGVIGWVICGILNALMYFTVTVDERKVQATLSASLQESSITSDDAHKESTLQKLVAEAEASFV